MMFDSTQIGALLGGALLGAFSGWFFSGARE